MTKTIFSIFLRNVAIVACLAVMTACGGGSSNKNAAQTSDSKKTTEAATTKGGTSLKDLNDNNWQAVIKANFGIDIKIPVGWTFKEVYSPNKVNNLKLLLNIGEGTSGEAEAKSIFEMTKALSPQGAYKASANWKAETVSAGDAINDISEVDAFKDSDVMATWAYTYNSKMILANVFMRGEVLAEYTFTINATK
ncbi:MAG: hypothetical protein LBR06_08985 [Bacteroidales bacterium]|jgi:hypothetical protein|nr:hypothetical protein [Bacteroidales bacterium]